MDRAAAYVTEWCIFESRQLQHFEQPKNWARNVSLLEIPKQKGNTNSERFPNYEEKMTSETIYVISKKLQIRKEIWK